jgi:hypothetical protein
MPTGEEVSVPSGSTADGRRIYPRWQRQFAVRYGVGSDLATGQGYEISEGGILFTGPRYYPAGTEIELHLLSIKDEREEWKIMRAAVRHFSHQKMGAEFLGMGVTERIHLLKSLS